MISQKSLGWGEFPADNEAEGSVSFHVIEHHRSCIPEHTTKIYENDHASHNNETVKNNGSKKGQYNKGKLSLLGKHNSNSMTKPIAHSHLSKAAKQKLFLSRHSTSATVSNSNSMDTYTTCAIDDDNDTDKASSIDGSASGFNTVNAPPHIVVTTGTNDEPTTTKPREIQCILNTEKTRNSQQVNKATADEKMGQLNDLYKLRLIRPTMYIYANDLHIDIIPPPFTNVYQDQAKEHPHLYKPSPSASKQDSKDNRLWIALNQYSDLHNQKPSPIAYQALDTLFGSSIQFVSDSKLWKCGDKKTEKITTPGKNSSTTQPTWHGLGIPSGSILRTDAYSLDGDVVLNWTALTSDSYVCVRAEGLIQASAEAVYDLMMDSSRAKAYNKYSMGRKDVWVMDESDDDEEDRISPSNSLWRGTKVVEGKNKPPLVRKPIEFRSLLHGRELSGDAGYLIASRSVKRLQEDGSEITFSSNLSNDLLVGVNLILRVNAGRDEGKDQCILVNASQFKSASMPTMLAKKMGLSGSISLLQDIQKVFQS